jgi:hypothetical protein
MLVACRLAGLSALETHYEGVSALTQLGATTRRDELDAIRHVLRDTGFQLGMLH